jgi:hypothetical protein
VKDPVVNFKDANIKVSIRKILNAPDGDIGTTRDTLFF